MGEFVVCEIIYVKKLVVVHEHTASHSLHADDPATDYWAVREELRMYNPEYCARPHVVALNKMDLQDAAQLQEEIASEVLTMAHRIQVGAKLRAFSIACSQGTTMTVLACVHCACIRDADYGLQYTGWCGAQHCMQSRHHSDRACLCVCRAC